MEKAEGADRRRITEILLTYGWHGGNALVDMIQQIAARDIWMDYTATMLFGIGKMFASSGWDFPTYHEMIDFERQLRKKTADEKSAGELLEEVKGKLMERG